MAEDMILALPSATATGFDLLLSIPHICHLDHLYIGGEKLVMWRNFRFQYTTDVEKSEILPDLEEFQNSTHDRCEEI